MNLSDLLQVALFGAFTKDRAKGVSEKRPIEVTSSGALKVEVYGGISLDKTIKLASDLDLSTATAAGLLGREGGDATGTLKSIGMGVMGFSGGALTINSGAVTLAMLANLAQGRLIGRSTAGTGVPEAVEPDGSTLELPAGGTLRVKDGGITLAKLANLAQGKLIGRSTTGTGVPEAVGPDGSTLELPAGGTLRVKDAGITDAKRGPRTIEAHTADDTLTTAECHVCHTNVGASGEVILTLPAGTDVGMIVSAYVAAAQYLRLKADAAHTIRCGKWSSVAGGYLRANAVGSSVTLLKVTSTVWVTWPEPEQVWWLEDTSSKEMPVGPPVLDEIFGDGRDADATISGTTYVTTTKYYKHLTIQNGGSLQVQCTGGAENTPNAPIIYVRGRLSGESGGVLTTRRGAGYVVRDGATFGAGARTTAGAGNTGWGYFATYHVFVSCCARQSGGTGGGVTSYFGGNILCLRAPSFGVSWCHCWPSANTTWTYGVVSNGPGTTATQVAGVFTPGDALHCPPLWGAPGLPGGGGALQSAGGSNTSGSGGNGAGAPGPLRIRAAVFDDQSGFVCHNDGEVGGNSDTAAVASNANGDIAGGGGAGAGSSGGLIAVAYLRRTAAGTVRSSGGAGGTGGVGKRRFDDDTALTAWATATAYTARLLRRPTVANGYGYAVTVAGTSHATTEPTWPTTPGQTVVDGTVTWVCVAEGSNQDDPSGSGANGQTGVAGPIVLEQVSA